MVNLWLRVLHLCVILRRNTDKVCIFLVDPKICQKETRNKICKFRKTCNKHFVYLMTEMGLAGKDLLEETKIEQVAFSLQDFRYPFTQVVLEKDPEVKVR